MKHKDLSKRTIKREEYLYLLSALEDNVITEEQFYRLLAHGNYADFIIEIMRLEDLKDKNQFFDKVMSLPYVTCDYEVAIELFNKYPVYKTDVEMRNFILENQIFFEDGSLKLLQRRFLRENKEFIDKLHNHAAYYMASESVFTKIENYLETYGKEYDDEKNLRILNTCLSVRESVVTRFIEYLSIEGLTKEPMWLDYLKKPFDESFSSHTIAYAFKTLEERGWLDKLTEKLYEIDENKDEEEKDRQFNNLYNNIRFLGKLKDEDVFNNTFDYLTEKDDDFRLRVELEKLKKVKNWDDATLNEYYEAMLDLVDNVRTYVMSRLNHTFITLPLIKSLKDVYYNEAERIILKRAIECGDIDYVESRKTYFEVEKLDSKFLLYLDVCKPNREELLAMRKKIEEAKSEYNGSEFVIKIENFSTEEKEEVREKAPQKKKSLFSLFKK